MKVSISSISPADLEVDALIMPLTLQQMERGERPFSALVGDAVGKLGEDFGGKHGQVSMLYPTDARARRLLVVGLGSEDALDQESIRRAMAALAEPCNRHKIATVALIMPEIPFDAEEACQAMVEGFALALYRFVRYKTSQEDRFEGPERLVIQAAASESKYRRGSNRGKILAEATAFARDMVNRSPDEKTATDLARMAERSASKYGYFAEVWGKDKIREEGMGGLLAVNRGSPEPPTFTILEWRPENASNERPVILVGKGVVFDTGGLSLKSTAGSMDHMKADMAGAAAVISAMEAIARLQVPLSVIALIPATDNRPGGNAYVPGEVVRMHSGKTVEVLNTDAEGRLILADALSFAKSFRPELVIDVATLTGAQIIALGSISAALFTNGAGSPSDHARRFEESGRRTGDYVFPMPLFDDYLELLKSDIADIKNVGGREAGSISAAKFLEQFVDYPWVHLDIAGPAFLDKPANYRTKGATGFGTRLLVDFLRHYTS